jgi:hypothetical protein
MLYAKINTTTKDVIEFFYDAILVNPLPEDTVLVDASTNFPNGLLWDQKANVTSISITENTYVANYEVISKYSNDADKASGISFYLQINTQENLRNLNSRISDLKKEYPDVESESWALQLKEAQEYQANNSATLMLLPSMANARQISVATLANMIINNATTYNNSYGHILGTYQKNYQILNSIKLDDSSTWNNINSYGGWN